MSKLEVLDNKKLVLKCVLKKEMDQLESEIQKFAQKAELLQGKARVKRLHDDRSIHCF